MSDTRGCQGCKGGGGCGEKKGCGACCGKARPLSEEAVSLLSRFAQTPFLPATRFIMRSQRLHPLSVDALAPVYIEDAQETFGTVRRRAAALAELSQRGLIDIDYDAPLSGTDYQAIELSRAYLQFAHAVKVRGEREGLFDSADVQPGSMALTGAGQQMLEDMGL